MRRNRQQHILRYPQSEGNLALAGIDLHIPPKPKVNADHATLRQPEQDVLLDYPESDNLSQTRGIFGAIGLSVMMWWLIIFAIYWIHFSLKPTRF